MVDPSCKTLAERARCEQCLLSKSHVPFKTYTWKWSEQNCWPPWKYVPTATIWSDPTYAPLRDALKRTLVNPEIKIAADVNFITMNIGSEVPEAAVTDSKSLDGVTHIIGMAPGTPLHSTVANMPYCLIFVEVPKGHMEGIHSVVSCNLVSGTLVLIVGEACDVLGVLDGLRKLHDNEGLTTIRVACCILASLTQQYSMGFTGLWVVSKNSLPKKVLLSALATCCLLPDSRCVHR